MLKRNVCSSLDFFFFSVYFCEYSALSILCGASAWRLPRTEAGISGVSCQVFGYRGSEEGIGALLMCTTALRDTLSQKQTLWGTVVRCQKCLQN